MSDSLWSCGLWPSRFLCPWDSPGKILEPGAISSSRGSSRSRHQTHVSCVSCICRHILYHCAHLGSPIIPLRIAKISMHTKVSVVAQMVESAFCEGDSGLIPGSERCPGEGNGNPLLYPCQEILGTEELGRLPSLGSQSVGHGWGTSLTTHMHTKKINLLESCKYGFV